MQSQDLGIMTVKRDVKIKKDCMFTVCLSENFKTAQKTCMPQ